MALSLESAGLNLWASWDTVLSPAADGSGKGFGEVTWKRNSWLYCRVCQAGEILNPMLSPQSHAGVVTGPGTSDTSDP